MYGRRSTTDRSDRSADAVAVCEPVAPDQQGADGVRTFRMPRTGVQMAIKLVGDDPDKLPAGQQGVKWPGRPLPEVGRNDAVL
jgi:hypothetical protein